MHKLFDLPEEAQDGQELINALAHGIGTQMKEELVNSIVEDMVQDFREKVQEVVSEKVAGMVFNASTIQNLQRNSLDMQILVDWKKADKEYCVRYKMVGETVEKGEEDA